MSDKGDKICPLCTEEMDLTDQQLKPCKCGYEICVWCWNQVMEMAERDKTEGRCPACRSIYDKERIVGMAANCERMVAEINSGKKLKSQKPKPKPSDGRMHLSNVRVIQRNLVYIIGLPLNLADEALLQRKEYFGQYGKVLKVSISKTATGVIQHSSNNSCCVYITYAKEVEAVLCIQTVHSFVLEGRPLRACFGTTKYCHSWLKNMPCTVPDCLYLHEFGSHDDSFTKDDLVSAFTRSKIQQNIGETNNLHRRSGNILPPPADDYNDRAVLTATPDCRTSLNTILDSDIGSCADIGAERSKSLPGAASWVMCVSSNVPNNKPEASSSPQDVASKVTSPKGSCDVKDIKIPEGSCEAKQPLVACGDMAITATESLGLTKSSRSQPVNEDDSLLADVEDSQGLSSAISSISISSPPRHENNSDMAESSIYSLGLSVAQGANQNVNQLVSSSAPPASLESSILEDILGFDDDQLSGSGDAQNLPSVPSLLSSKQNLKHLDYRSWQQGKMNNLNPVNAHQSALPIKCDASAISSRSGMPMPSNAFCNDQLNGHMELNGAYNYPSFLSAVESREHSEACDNNMASSGKKSLDMGEDSIISSILSLDMDTWEDTLTSPQNLAKLLNETEQCALRKVPSLRKAQDSRQSRFSFARQDDFTDMESNLGPSLVSTLDSSAASYHSNDSKFCMDNKYHNISINGTSVESNSFLPSHPLSASKFSVPKTPTSPPGFTISNRAVPPGFSTNGIVNYEATYIPENCAPFSRKIGGSVDEFFDPTIMEVSEATRMNTSGFGMRQALSPQLNSFDRDTELQMLMQQPVSVKQNYRYPELSRSRFSPPNDGYRISSVLLGQSPPNNTSPFTQVPAQQIRNVHRSNGRWGGWDEYKSVNNVGMQELLVNGRLGFNKFIPSHEDLKYSSSNLYNRGFAL